MDWHLIKLFWRMAASSDSIFKFRMANEGLNTGYRERPTTIMRVWNHENANYKSFSRKVNLTHKGKKVGLGRTTKEQDDDKHFIKPHFPMPYTFWEMHKTTKWQFLHVHKGHMVPCWQTTPTIVTYGRNYEGVLISKNEFCQNLVGYLSSAIVPFRIF